MKDFQLNARDIAPFVRVADVNTLIPILESRLPRCAQVYNTVRMYPKFQKEINLYTLDLDADADAGQPSTNAWIISVYTRKDISQDVTVSAPESVRITAEVKDAFLNSKILDWSQSYVFSAVVRPISLLICEISLIKGRNAKLFPCVFYYCPKDEASALDTSHADDVELKPLDLISGPNFTYNSWAYSVDGSLDYITQSIERNISSGVYAKKDGKPVSGILTVASGLMGMLYTDKAYRNKNYGKLCMQQMMKELAKKGFIPCSTVEICNEVSRNFHVKIGMKPCDTVDFIRYDGPTKFK